MNKIKALRASLAALWASLPHPVQAMLIASGTAAATTFAHSFSEGGITVATLKHSIGLSVAAGLAVARAFYMIPNKPAPAPPVAIDAKKP